MKPRQMQLLIDEDPRVDGDHLVAAIGELIAAILDMNHRIAMRQVAAIDVSDARHGSALSDDDQPASERSARVTVISPAGARSPLPRSSAGERSPLRSALKTPSDFSLRCSAERSMPTNAAVREILPPKR